MAKKIEIITKRLQPRQDLRKEIERLAKAEKIGAGCILSVVGSLKKATLRMVGSKIVRTWDKPFEVVSGTGTLSKDDIHIHLSIADVNGNVKGGHLREGCIISTTVELVILSFPGISYKRMMDKRTGFKELSIE